MIFNNLQPVTRAILVTIGCLTAYEAGNSVHFPFFSVELTATSSQPVQFSLFTIYFIPAISGFFYVEILSFIIPRLKKHRSGGVNGRKFLNYYAIVAAILVAVWQASWLASTFYHMNTIPERPVIQDFSVNTIMLLAGFFFIGFGILIWLGVVISRHGIGNGFCILVGYAIIKNIGFNLYMYTTDTLSLNNEPNLIGVGFMVIVIAILVEQIRKPAKLQATLSGNNVFFEIPMFPQGIVPILWTTFVMSLLLTFSNPDVLLFDHDISGLSYVVPFSIGLLATGFISFFLICAPARITNNTFGKLQFQEGWRSQVKRAAKKGVLMMTALSLLLSILPIGGITDYFIKPLAELIVIVAISRDIFYQYKFMSNVKKYRVMHDFDNVHYVTMLKGLFERENIKFCIQGFEFRRLYFFFNPLYKMKLLVADSDFERAAALVDLQNIKTI